MKKQNDLDRPCPSTFSIEEWLGCYIVVSRDESGAFKCSIQKDGRLDSRYQIEFTNKPEAEAALEHYKNQWNRLKDSNRMPKLATEIENVPESKETHYGSDCPEGMVQVEFVGCSPENRMGDYGWKPEKSAFMDVWVDGKRFNIQLGDITGNDRVVRRGISINSFAEMKVRASNEWHLVIPDKHNPPKPDFEDWIRRFDAKTISDKQCKRYAMDMLAIYKEENQ